jgi:hypothetical protein
MFCAAPVVVSIPSLTELISLGFVEGVRKLVDRCC